MKARAPKVKTGMRRFILNRKKDISGVSGTSDKIAEGIEFSSGKCVITWLTSLGSVEVCDNIKTLEEIHGHLGATTVEWIDKNEHKKEE